MKNGPYTLVVAPPEYPGKRYRGKYCYEHRLNFWLEHGYLPGDVHHANENKRDNNAPNLAGMTHGGHTAHHNVVEKVKLICEFCTKEFEVLPRTARSYKKTGQSVHCSRSCSVKHQWDKRRLSVPR